MNCDDADLDRNTGVIVDAALLCPLIFVHLVLKMGGFQARVHRPTDRHEVARARYLPGQFFAE